MGVRLSDARKLTKTERRVENWSNKQVIHPNFECKLRKEYVTWNKYR